MAALLPLLASFTTLELRPGSWGMAAAAFAVSALLLAGAAFAFQSARRVKLLTARLAHAEQTNAAVETNLRSAHLQFVEGLARALDARDPYTAGHSMRVGAFARATALHLGCSTEEAETLRIAGELHDIGKIGVSDAILQKPGRLTEEEFAKVKFQPQIARKILERVKPFANLLDMIELHHENHDGSGYPYGLTGEAVPLAARILHVADAFDAMMTDRSYRAAFSMEGAIAELEAHAGGMFDPAVVEAFLARLRSQGLDEIVLSSGLLSTSENRGAILTPTG